MSTKALENTLSQAMPDGVHFRIKCQGEQEHLDILFKSKRLAWVSEDLARTLYISSMAQQWLTLAQAKVAQASLLRYAQTPIDKR